MGNKATKHPGPNKKPTKHVQINKFVLLGTAGCGKSTIFRQLMRYNRIPSDPIAMVETRELLLANSILFMNSLLKLYAQLVLMDPRYKQEHVDQLVKRHAIDLQTGNMDMDKVQCLGEIWKCSYLKELYAQHWDHELFMWTCDPRLLSYYEQLLDTNCTILQEAELFLSARTSSIKEYCMQPNMIVCDIGGMRAQRRRWIHCLHEMTHLVYVVSLIEFCLLIAEDGITNCMLESLALMKELFTKKYVPENCKRFLVFTNRDRLLPALLKKDFSSLESFEDAPDLGLDRSQFTIDYFTYLSYGTTSMEQAQFTSDESITYELFNMLSDDECTIVCQFLTIADVLNLSLVSREMRQIVSNDVIWKRIARNRGITTSDEYVMRIYNEHYIATKVTADAIVSSPMQPRQFMFAYTGYRVQRILDYIINKYLKQVDAEKADGIEVRTVSTHDWRQVKPLFQDIFQTGDELM